MLRKNLLKIIEEHNLVERFLSEYFGTYVNLEFIKEGHENASYSFTADNKSYVLRISKPEKDIERLDKEIRFMNYLNENDIPAPEVIENKRNELISIMSVDDQDIKTIVMNKMKGNSPRAYTEKLIYEIGRWMAEFHLTSSRYPHTSSDNLSLETEYFTHNELNVEEIENEQNKEFLQEAKDFRWNISNLPQGIIHSDFHKNNLLTVDDSITGILDFDDITKSAFVRDIGVMINNIVYGYLFNDSSLERIRILLRAYQEVRKLNELEIQNLTQATLFRNYGLAAFFYWIEDFDLKEYKDMKKVIASIDFNMYLDE